ncbi:MAG: hypothetical protein QXG03_09235 [Halalkalicoccus sp.]
MSDPIETLRAVSPQDHVRVTLLNGDQLEGTAQPVEVEPGERLRIELRTGEADHAVRYDVRAAVESGEWETPTARRYDVKHEDGEWVTMGDVREATVLESSSDREDRSSERL